jgi:hypothetical protein
VVVLLRPEAELSSVNGRYQSQFAGQEPHVTFRYQLVRVWQLPTAQLLAGGPGTLPLAPISAVSEADLPAVIERMKQRLDGLRPRARAAKLWTATYVLMGLRYPAALTERLLQGVISMEESSTYQAIVAKGLAKGSLQEAKKFLRLLGEKRLGTPDPQATAALDAITEVERLEQLGLRLEEVGNWHELLGLPAARPRRRRKPTS